MERSLRKLEEKAVLPSGGAAAALGRVSVTTSLADAVRAADLVIEAIPEDLSLKQKTFEEVEAAAPPTALLATNTSTMTMQDVAARVRDPRRFVGLHFFNPVPIMRLIEVIPHAKTSEATLDEVKAFARAVDKDVVVCHRDLPGFITSRLVGAWIQSACRLVEAGVAGPIAIDRAAHAARFPMGPFELADYTGIDISVHASRYIASKLGPAYAPSPLLVRLADAGHLGKKTGQGFYVWREGKLAGPAAAAAETQAKAPPFDAAILLSAMANEAARLVGEGAGAASEIDYAMRVACAFPKGPLVDVLESIGKVAAHPMFDPSPELLARAKSDAANAGGRDAAVPPFTGTMSARGPGGIPSASASRSPSESGESSPLTPARSGNDAALDGPYATLRVQEPGPHVCEIALHRPSRLNAMSPELIRELGEVTRRIEARPDLRVVLLTGSGERAFCAGADLSETQDIHPVQAESLARSLSAVLSSWEHSPKLFVAALNGVAYGGGLEIALACDFRVAARRAKAGLPEVTLDLLPASGGTQRLPKLIGLSRAQEMVLLGGKYDAETLAAWGLLHRVFPDESFASDARAFAAALARGAPLAQAHAKRGLRTALAGANEVGAEFEAASFGVLLATADAVEGVAAMMTKRAPEFKGQ
jgi:enoyl-CoA hydratase/3-hydroxyacyl-CoA dehydrogenase